MDNQPRTQTLPAPVNNFSKTVATSATIVIVFIVLLGFAAMWINSTSVDVKKDSIAFAYNSSTGEIVKKYEPGKNQEKVIDPNARIQYFTASTKPQELKYTKSYNPLGSHEVKHRDPENDRKPEKTPEIVVDTIVWNVNPDTDGSWIVEPYKRDDLMKSFIPNPTTVMYSKATKAIESVVPDRIEEDTDANAYADKVKNILDKDAPGNYEIESVSLKVVKS